MSYKQGLIGLIAVLLTACSGVEEVPITDWVRLADFPGAARASATTFAVGNKAYICCGRTGIKYDALNEVWQYDSQANTWTQLDTFPGKPRVRAVGVSINGKGYVGMGSTGIPYENSVFTDFYEFDPTTGKWTSKAPFPGFASNDLAYAVVNGCLYTAMGFSGTGTSNDTFKYDPVTDTWTKLEDCLGYYIAPTAFSIGNNFYVAGGYQGRNIRTVFCFDTESKKWSSAPSMPQGRVLSLGLEVAGKGYVMLGRYWAGTESGGHLLSDIVEYDANEKEWTKRGNFPGGARQNAMVFTIAGRAYVVMGENDAQRLKDVWSFKP